MKIKLKSSLFLFCSLIVFDISAQNIYPVLITKSGLLAGKIISYNDSPNSTVINSLPDTISSEEIKNAFALNAIYIDKSKGIQKLNINEFEFKVVESQDTTILYCKSSLLTNDIRKKLKKIREDAYIYFQGIKAASDAGLEYRVTLLAFYIK